MKRFLTKILQKFMNIESGMTLIELIVAISIVAILLAATTTMLPYYRDSQLLKQGGLDLNDSLRYAQTMALEKDKNSNEYVAWKLLDVHKVCVIDSKELAKDANCEQSRKIFEFDKKLNITSNLDNLYFQGGTANIYDSDDFTTADLARIEVAVKHSNRSQIGDTYYGVKIAANSFGMISDSIKEDSGSEIEEPVNDNDDDNYNDNNIPKCPDYSCNGNETCASCPTDCGECVTNEVVCNYDRQCNGNETIDNCSDCQQIIYGCKDSLAINYNSEADLDDGSCKYDVYGCMDIDATNFNAKATKPDNSCIYSLPDGEQCTVNERCASGYCDGVCKTKLTVSMPCTKDIQCQSGKCGQCKKILIWTYCFCE